jgi:hypothetical protein
MFNAAFFLALVFVSAQQSAISGLKYHLLVMKIDKVKVSSLESLSTHNLFFPYKPNSSFYYCKEFKNDDLILSNKKYLILANAPADFNCLISESIGKAHGSQVQALAMAL